MPPDTYVNQIQRVGTDTGGLAPAESAVIFPAAQFTITDHPGLIVTGPNGESITGATVVTAAALGPSPTFTNLTVTGTIKQGPATSSASSSVTTADATVTLLSLDLPTGSFANFDLRIVTTDGTKEYAFALLTGSVLRTLGGMFTGTLSQVETSAAGKAMPFSPSVDLSWTGGVLTITGMGPHAIVVGTADNGAGNVRVTVGGGGPPLGTTLTGKSVTGVGVGGTVEADGPHIATRHSDTEFDLDVAFSNAWTSGGTFTLTTPPMLTWSSYALLLVATPPP